MSITLPHDASLNGHRVDAVLSYLTISTGLVFGVMALILLAAVIFHSGRRRKAQYTHGDRMRDRLVAVAAGLVVLFGIDAVAVIGSSDQLRKGFWRFPDGDGRALRVEVTGQQWAWTFRYAGADGRFATADDIVTLNELRVPLHRPIYLQLTSKDVVHSFYLPNFRNKIDVIPGTVTRLWFQPREVGVFEIACAQHCGAWHYKMRGELAVMTADAFVAWSLRAATDTALRRSHHPDVTLSVPKPAPGPAGANAGGAGGAAATPTDLTSSDLASLSDGWEWIPPRE